MERNPFSLFFAEKEVDVLDLYLIRLTTDLESRSPMKALFLLTTLMDSIKI